MSHAAKLDDVQPAGWCGRSHRFLHPGWVALMILGFVAWWPIGLAILAYYLWSRNMGCWRHGGVERWQRKMERLQAKMEQFGERRDRPSSGNRAFDEYRAETLRRLEEEQREFREFLDRLRFARDKTEFDQFMNERRNRPPSSESPPPESPQPQG
ncbi:MAG TPA: DUF2852 domain-containing protein [Azospirillum sp.]|nr:DUF2852 domain-containing protein [Azospirillum sp.]